LCLDYGTAKRFTRNESGTTVGLPATARVEQLKYATSEVRQRIEKPGIRQISEPERTRSLPNRHLNLSDKDLVVKAAGDFGRGGCFKKER
jgi:hypothetical protein